MAHQPPNKLLSFLGYVYWGDIAELTLYCSKRGRIVFFKKTYPKKPASPLQQAQRDRLTAAAVAWRALTEDQRKEWNLATRRASLTMHGYDLFVHWQLIHDDKAIEAVQRQTKTNLIPI